MSSGDRSWMLDQVDVGIPSAARIYDYALGGGHNLASDREMFERLLVVQPRIREMVWANRSFLRRAVLFMVERGIRQFLDLGSGIPTVGNVHEIAQCADPACRIVYVDRDDVAVAHSRLILAGNDRAAVIEEDITRWRDVLRHPDTRRQLDLDRPVGLLAVTVGHYITDDEELFDLFDAYRAALAPGSALGVTHMTDDFERSKVPEIVEAVSEARDGRLRPRTKALVRRMFGDFELVPPGLVPPSAWRPDAPHQHTPQPGDDGSWAGVAVKPPGGGFGGAAG